MTSSQNNPWFSVCIGLIGLIVGYGIASANLSRIAYVPSPTPSAVPTAPSAAKPPPAQEAGPVPPVTKDDHVRGKANAKVTIVEYSDYECPFCKRHHPTMKQVMDAYPNDVNWVYRHYPLSFHKNAQKEAEAAECIAELGGNDAFWKFTDAIYDRTTSNGTGFALDKLGPLAKEIGVDQKKFQTCLDSDKYAKLVQDQEAGGAAAGIRGTPGSIIIDNGTKKTSLISGAVPLDRFKTAIDEILKK